MKELINKILICSALTLCMVIGASAQNDPKPPPKPKPPVINPKPKPKPPKPTSTIGLVASKSWMKDS